MQDRQGQLTLSASDVVNLSTCEHWTALDLAALRGHIDRPDGTSEELAVIAEHGQAHERRHLQQLIDDGVDVADLSGTACGWDGQHQATVDAMRTGRAVIYQATLHIPDHRFGGWVGHVDFLQRVDLPADTTATLTLPDGTTVPLPWTYQPADTKLARTVKPSAVVQIAMYRRMLTHLLDRVPDNGAIVTGDNATHTVDLTDVDPYVARLETRLIDIATQPGNPLDQGTYPYPNPACATCPWADVCAAQRAADDHISGVADIRRSQADKLAKVGITTVAALADLHQPDQRHTGKPLPKTGIPATTLAKLASQAHWQRQTITNPDPDVPAYATLPLEDGQGLLALPAPSPGDIFFDMEGDPLANIGAGLEYLFGAIDLDGSADEPGCVDVERVTAADAGGAPATHGGLTDMRFLAWWAHDPTQEKAAFEAFIDYVTARRDRYPDLHVYHYAPYEKTALQTLSAKHATRERDVDRLLRDGVLVDLYRVVRKGLVVGADSYSIKKLEPLYMQARTGDVTSAGSSIVGYERWLDTGDQTLLDDIRAYNRDDVVSTRLLRDWLETLRADAGPSEQLTRPTRDAQQETLDDDADEQDQLVATLRDAAAAADDEEVGGQLTLLADLVGWHDREARQAWWAYFARIDADTGQLWSDSDAIVGVTGTDVPDEIIKRSVAHTLRFDPSQPTKLGRGDNAYCADTGARAGSITSIDPVAGRLTLKRGLAKNGEALPPLPTNLMSGGPINARVLADAVRDLADHVADHPDGPAAALADDDPTWHAARDLLRAASPRLTSGHSPGQLMDAAADTPTGLTSLFEQLEATVVAVQGPPGTGKTYTASRAILAAVTAGRRVGVSANSHAAIRNLLAGVVSAADQAGLARPDIVYKGHGTLDGVTVVSGNRDVVTALGGHDLGMVVGGTTWLHARPEMADQFDLLVVDEAGQLSLANTLAISRAADSIVLVGDPQQLTQPTQAVHPGESGRSALEHLLGDHPTVPTDRGVFLPESFRMHPDVCQFISDRYYARQLRPAAGTGTQQIVGTADGALDGAGLTWVPVEHSGRTTMSPEEADTVVATARRLLAGDFHPAGGAAARPMTSGDVLVVAPFNAHVQQVTAALSAAGLGDVRVGTVDRFQGQQAPAVIFTLGVSSADDVPRGLEFLLSPNRWNVAISRAQARTVVVGSPALLDATAANVDDMRTLSGLLAYVSAADSR